MTIETVSPGEALRCARHPNTETFLRCGRCETPICPKCQIQTPVGARCPTCAQVKRFALMLKPRELARSIGYGVGAAALGTLIFAYLPFLGPLISFGLIGFAVGEAVSRGGNRKGVRALQFIAVGCLVVGFVVGLLLARVLQGDEVGVVTLFQVLLILRQPLFLVGLLVGALLAWMRAR